MLEDKFFFNINNLYLMMDNTNKKVIGVVCIVDKSVDLNYDYSELEKVNERYKFIIDNYIKGLIKEVEDADFAYISNVCVHPEYRGMHIGSMMIREIVEIYRKKLFEQLVLDVLADNMGAIKLYQNYGFEQTGDKFKGFNAPNLEKPDVFTMKSELNSKKNIRK